ncbi:MAG: bifunctional diaminohydroxyphosphoribosylaminopyrimidine deaminase/5-amino-6-(5-phosphoribosylamino)uracil reductase RibD [Ruminococcus sp.]|nr:bifunctional diaminohydroxyphosphoribosylaminopyrimidine deaminase/5-amino-6-(5-phosphoribosylamino)uracil reductase RibD [Ruminococcus sp.]
MDHEEFMRKALELAKKGMGFTSPNPMVGAVIVRDGKIIGYGWHRKYGDLHAERSAFAYCDENGIDCTGADMYVTLEPCCHHGKQPPCTDAVIAHGIKRVFIGSADPNPWVAGKGVKILRENGIEVVEDILKEECDALNEIFFHYITKDWPFVTVKYAMTLDGKIATCTGESKWITGEEARLDVQRERLRHSAIMVGIGTVLADDPLLTCRLENGRNPIRIICDSNLRIPLESKIVQTAKDVPTIIAMTSYNKGYDREKREKRHILEEMGCTIISTAPNPNRVDLYTLVMELSRKKIDSILVEGGGELIEDLFRRELVTKVKAYIAPKIFGGRNAKTPVEGMGVKTPDNAYMIENTKIQRIGTDILIEGKVVYK